MQRDVPRDFAERSAADAEGGGHFGEAISVGVPGSGRQVEEQVFGEGFRYGWTLRAESSESADSAAKLQGKDTRANFREASAIPQNGIEPACNDESKRCRKRLLHPGSGHDERVPMRFD
jgi:hypothetical protein